MAKKKPVRAKRPQKKKGSPKASAKGPQKETPTAKKRPKAKTVKKRGQQKRLRPATARSSGKRQESEQENPSCEGLENGFPIVGVGASAGGLKALRTLLEAMPDEPGLALVVIQHLDPTKTSLTPALLSKCTTMQVAHVNDDPHIKPNNVYVLPPDKYLSISGGVLHLSDPGQPRGLRMAIDFFLRSLAADSEHRSVGVILSGSGTDGTLGVKAIKLAGGLVIAQDPATAEFDMMPRSAIDTGGVDHVLPPQDIPEVLVRHAQHPYVRERVSVAPAAVGLPQESSRSDEGFSAVVALLRTHTKHDFRNYKEKTLIRRMRRRMCLNYIEDFDEYARFLRQHPSEIEALSKDVLITVTDFFREIDAWNALQELAIQPMVQHKEEDEPIRVWTPGCATGEEPYSVAMLILEELKRARKHCPLNVFASDIEKTSLAYAREGRYPKSIEADVSSQRLRRYFTIQNGDDNYYYVNKLLRDSVVFADQDLVSDPPFSRLDLICCRNLLIYLKPDVQEKVIALFHFALRQGGVLFLGSAETIGHQTDLFETLDKRWRIFRRIGQSRHDRVDIPTSRVQYRREIDIPSSLAQRRESRMAHLAQQRLLEVMAPSAVLIDSQWRILYITGDVDAYLVHKPGPHTDDLLKKARRGLRSKLRVAVQRALSQQRTVSVPARVHRNSAYHSVTLTVRVIHDREQGEDLALVYFGEGQAEPSAESARHSTPPALTSRSPPEPDEDLDDQTVIRQLEDELAATKEDLQPRSRNWKPRTKNTKLRTRK